MSDNRLKVVFLSTSKSKIQQLKEVAEDKFEDKGYNVVWRSSYPNVGLHDIEAALYDEDMKKKNCEWLRSVPANTIRSLLRATTGDDPVIRAWGLHAQPVQTIEWYDIADELIDSVGGSETITYVLLSASPKEKPVGTDNRAKNQNAPFSYDPSQSYYTEPDRP